MAYPPGMMEFALLASMRRAEAARATTPLMMTMLPGPAAQRAAVSAIAVTNQVQDGLRRERRVAEETVEAVVDAAKDPAGVTLEKLRAIPGLRDIASAALVEHIAAAPAQVADALSGVVRSETTASTGSATAGSSSTASTAAPDPKIASQAVDLATTLMRKGQKLTAAEASPFSTFIATLSATQRASLIR